MYVPVCDTRPVCMWVDVWKGGKSSQLCTVSARTSTCNRAPDILGRCKVIRLPRPAPPTHGSCTRRWWALRFPLVLRKINERPNEHGPRPQTSSSYRETCTIYSHIININISISEWRPVPGKQVVVVGRATKFVRMQ